MSLSIVLSAASIRLQGNTLRQLTTPHTPELGSAPNLAHIGTLGIPCAAITLLLGHRGGLYWLSPTTIVYFTWAAVNAWLLMVQASDYVN